MYFCQSDHKGAVFMYNVWIASARLWQSTQPNSNTNFTQFDRMAPIFNQYIMFDLDAGFVHVCILFKDPKHIRD